MITGKRCEIGCKLVLFTNIKSYTGFRLVPRSVTLNDLERRNDRAIFVIADLVTFLDTTTRILSTATVDLDLASLVN